MIKKLFKEAHVFYQKSDSDDLLPEPAISISKDNGEPSVIILAQEGNEIILNKKSLKELCEFLKKY